VRALVSGTENSFAGPSAQAAFAAALAGGNPEYSALVAEHGRHVVGVVLYGSTAGAEGAGRLSLLVVDPTARRQGVGGALVQAAVAALRRSGHRFVGVEIPDDRLHEAIHALLVRCGFRIESTVPDYYRDGIALTILRRDLDPS
jgi:ribosomal protein S18 acetylase RimI-like enzyme